MCVAQTCKRYRRKAKNDKRYASGRKDASSSARREQEKRAKETRIAQAKFAKK